MSLFQKADVKAKRLKMYVYGTSGMGKTIISLHFPNPAVIDSEKGTDFYGEQFDFYRLQTSDHRAVGHAIDELLADPQNFKTFVIDPFTSIDESIVSSQLKRMRVKKADPNYSLQPLDYKSIKEERKNLISKLLSLDMNIILTARSKPQYSDEEGEFMKVIGNMADGPKELPYLFDVVLELTIVDNVRTARVIKDRTNKLPQTFEFSYPSFVKYIGLEGLEREAVVFNQQINIDSITNRQNEINFEGKKIKTAGINAHQLDKIQTLLTVLDKDKVELQLLDDYQVSSFLDLRFDEADLFIETLNQ